MQMWLMMLMSTSTVTWSTHTLSWAACAMSQCPPLPTPTCAVPPVRPPLMAGGQPLAPAPRAGHATVIVEASAAYLTAVLSAVAARTFVPSNCVPVTSTADLAALANCVGADVTSVTLSEDTRNGERVNLIGIGFSAWFTDGTKKTMLPDRTYTARLRMVPYLTAPSTVASPDERRALLGCAAGAACDTGVVAEAQFDALLGGPHAAANTPISCTTPGYDVVDDKVAFYVQQFAGSEMARRRIPLDAALAKLGDEISLALGPSHAVKLTGIDVASDGTLDLAAAFAIDGTTYTPGGFDASVSEMTRMAGDADLAVSLDSQLIKLATDAFVPRFGALGNGVHVDTLNVALQQDVNVPGFATVQVNGHYNPPVCNSFPFRGSALVRPKLCVGTTGGVHATQLSVCVDHVTVDVDISIINHICIDALGVILATPVGLVVAAFTSNLFVPVLVGFALGPLGGVIVGETAQALANRITSSLANDKADHCFALASGLKFDGGPFAGNIYPSGLFLLGGATLGLRSDLRGRSESGTCTACIPNRPDLCTATP
jgi:hypothetical protein